MKKILTLTLLAGFLAVLVLPVAVSAVDTAAPQSCKMGRNITLGNDITCTQGDTIQLDDQEKAACCLLNTLYNITDWIFVILVAVATIFVIIGAFNILTSGGSPEKVTKGREMILYAAIGLMVAFLAKAVPALVKLVSSMQS